MKSLQNSYYLWLLYRMLILVEDSTVWGLIPMLKLTSVLRR